jgi:hypothetical protein
VNPGSLRSPWSVRVYTIVLISILVLTSAGAAAPIRITVEPTMMKGPAGAPVTIIEFSDYQ